MSTSLTTTKETHDDDALAFISNPSPEALQAALAEGQLQKLSVPQRLQFLAATCKSIGLNPLSRPFEFITLQGKMVMYARKDATDQLRRMQNVSLKIVSREIVGDVLMVTAQAVMPGGRQDEAIGAVPWPKTGAEAQAMAAMKCETKAKRRVTLSICGLGFMDESEIGDAQTAGSFSEVSAPTMPTQADVLPKSEPESIDVEPLPPDAEDESQAPAAEDNIDERLLELLAAVSDSTHAVDLNECLRIAEGLESEASRRAAWAAMKNRADAVGVKFAKTTKQFK